MSGRADTCDPFGHATIKRLRRNCNTIDCLSAQGLHTTAPHFLPNFIPKIEAASRNQQAGRIDPARQLAHNAMLANPSPDELEDAPCEVTAHF
jgi:hypothetical protein